MDQRISILLVGSLLFILSCKVGYHDLSNPRQPYVGDEIRTDGYYFFMDTVDRVVLGDPQTEVVNRVYFFYRNGVMNYYNFPFLELDSLEDWITDSLFVARRKQHPVGWGIFRVNANKIKIETWVMSTGGKHPTYKYSLDIVNDSTFYKKNSNQSMLFQFKEFINKPDSTSNYIN